MNDGQIGGLYPETWLAATGKRSRRRRRKVNLPRIATSSQVATSGEVRGIDPYEVLDDVA